MMSASYPRAIVHHQVLRTHCATGLSIGIEFVSFLLHVRRVRNGPALERGRAMPLSTRTETTATKSHIPWMGTLAASVTSFLAGARPQPQPDLATTKHSRVFCQRGGSLWAAPACGMLVASDVSRKSAGLVP